MTSTCPGCLGEYKIGFALAWHKKQCPALTGMPAPKRMRTTTTPLSAYYDDDDGVTHDTFEEPEEIGAVSEDDGCSDTGDLMVHLMNPEHRCLLRYWGWGASPLSTKDREILDFLAVVDGAGGMSTAAAARVLKYVRARGNATVNLPKSITTCWKYVDRVWPSLLLSCINCIFKLQFHLKFAFYFVFFKLQYKNNINCNFKLPYF